MRVGLRERPNRITVRELQQRGLPYVYCQIGNKRGFIVGPQLVIETIKRYKEIQVSLFEYEEISIMEQHMQLQMGRNPTKKREVMRNYRGRIIGDSKSNQAYFVWDVV